MILSDEEAKAAQEVTKATGKAIDVAAGAGTMLVNSTVAKIATATLGLIGGDWVQEAQVRNLARLKAKTARMLDGIDQARLSEPSPSVVRPLLEAAADESRRGAPRPMGRIARERDGGCRHEGAAGLL